MTKKHYELIAEGIANSKLRVKSTHAYGYICLEVMLHRLAGIKETETTMADELELDNPRFDRDKFHKACEA